MLICIPKSNCLPSDVYRRYWNGQTPVNNMWVDYSSIFSNKKSRFNVSSGGLDIRCTMTSFVNESIARECCSWESTVSLLSMPMLYSLIDQDYTPDLQERSFCKPFRCIFQKKTVLTSIGWVLLYLREETYYLLRIFRSSVMRTPGHMTYAALY